MMCFHTHEIKHCAEGASGIVSASKTMLLRSLDLSSSMDIQALSKLVYMANVEIMYMLE
jgi:hypothetical protein